MSQLVKAGYTHLVAEVTSQGIYQFRTWGIKPDVIGLTNITPEHLDYHLSYENYVAAKVLLLKKAQTAIINESDQSYTKVKRALKSGLNNVITYSSQESLPPKFPTTIKARFPEPYNQMNARLAIKICQHLGLSSSAILDGIPSFVDVPGRKQVLRTRQGVRVVIDFAHTPNAVASILSELRAEMIHLNQGGKLIAVFGCAGLRDAIKRPHMGELGAALADLAVFTAEDPRTENVWTIIRQMKEKLSSDHDKVISIADREEAITFALQQLARKGDTVAILGKGHENSMCYGKVEYPWSDEAVVRKASSIIS
jgi:UDP-N-acetylmuramoyl-L-alanyl-D-glutamate--2,6-diaminopimelate ligase